MSAIVACMSWVPKGAAKENPEKIQLSKEDLQRLINVTKEDLVEATVAQDDANESDDDWEDVGDEETGEGDAEMEVESTSNNNDEDDLAIYNLDNYDDDEGGEMMTGAGLAGLTYYASNEDDPYVTMKDEDDEDIDDMTIQAGDNLIAVGRTEDVFSHIEIHLWNNDSASTYVHHDILLSSFPLCMEWLNFDPGQDDNKGNLLAVGTMEPVIEIWDLDVMDCPDPAFKLGRKKNKKKKIKAEGHTKEVPDLSWNTHQQFLLASCSADHTVRLWDLREGSCLRTFKHHSAKVEHLEWNTHEPAVLLSSSADKKVAVVDSRAPEAVGWFQQTTDVDSLTWNPHVAQQFVIGLEDGLVRAFDVRNPSASIYTLAAHDESVSTLSFSPQTPGALASGSIDEKIKLWDCTNDQPAFVFERARTVGPVYSVAFSKDNPLTIAIGGHNNGLQIIDLFESAAVRRHFGKRHPTASQSGERKEQSKANEPAGPAESDDEDEDWEDIMEGLSLRQPQRKEPKQQRRQAPSSTKAIKKKLARKKRS